MINPTYERPKLADVRAEVARSLTTDQLQLISVWLGLEAIESGSDEMFQAGKRLLAEAERKGNVAR